jgi:hypothetical protein
MRQHQLIKGTPIGTPEVKSTLEESPASNLRQHQFIKGTPITTPEVNSTLEGSPALDMFGSQIKA